jgi:DNA-binding NarL/FixJ family response regulator
MKVPDSSISIVVIDDHSVVRQGLEHMLADYTDMAIVGSAESGWDGIDRVVSLQPRVVLLDLSLPDIHGLDVLRKLREKAPSSQVVVLTIHDQPNIASQALGAGAQGYVLKDASTEELITAIRLAARGQQYVSSSVVRSFIPGATAQTGSAQLTEREWETLRLMAEGLSNREIAEEMILSVETVKSHVSSILRKLDASDRAQAVSKGFRTGLIK